MKVSPEAGPGSAPRRTASPSVASLAVAFAAAPLFCILAIANSAGYRYGVSDLSFYLPAAFDSIDPALFPRDDALLQTQARLTVTDELLGAALRAAAGVGIGPEALLYVLHVATLLTLFAAAILLGRSLFRSPWSNAALAAALTLRHAVARTGVNTLEGYFHPRVLAFAIGAAALGVFLRRGAWPALALVCAAGLVHPTTALWFAVLVGTAGLVGDRRHRASLAALGVGAALAAGWTLVAGPLAGRLAPMDGEWLSVIADRTYLFADRWPLHVWATHAFAVAVIAVAGSKLRSWGRLTPREQGLFAGAAALVAIFLALLPFVASRRAMAIQLQPARIFWTLDLLAVVSIVWLADALAERGWQRAPMYIALVLTLCSAARGTYLVTARFPERSILPVRDDSPWADVMQWAATQTPPDAHWLAHPDHAFRHGTSVRVSGKRDVFHDQSKDAAVAMYDRSVAMRVRERAEALAGFDQMDAGAFTDLARRYDLDFLVTERQLPLPVAYRNSQFFAYRLR